MGKYSISQKISWKKGFFMGLNIRKKKKSKIKNSNKRPLKDKPRYLGPSFVNGKFYDTNFKKPVPITKSDLEFIRKEYNSDGRRTDAQMVDAYLSHMRRKFGFFEPGTGKFLGLMGDD